MKLLSLFIFSLLGSAISAYGQAESTADRGVGFDIFAMGSGVNPDYGMKETGFSVGANAVRHFRKASLFDAGLETRLSMTSGNVSEHTYFVGPRLEKRVGRVHLYGDAFFGHGTLGLTNGTTSGRALAAGGGLELDVTRNLAFKLDYLHESWKISSAPNGLTPSKISVGITWRFTLGGDKIVR